MNNFGIDKVILKNEEDKKYLESLADPKNIRIAAISDQLCEDLDRRFAPKNPYPDPKTRKEKRKAKKFKKSYRGHVITNVNWRRLKIAIPAFFLILLVGAIVGWILMAGRVVNMRDNFVFSGLEAPEVGVSRQIDDERYFMSKLSKDYQFQQLDYVRVTPNADMAEKKLDYIKFSIMSRYNISLGINVYISDVGEYSSLATSGDNPISTINFDLHKNKAQTITISLGNAAIGDGNSIWIEIDWSDFAVEWFDLALFHFRARR